MALFQKSVLTTFSQDESKVALRFAEYHKFLAKVDAIKGFKEEEYQDGFFKDVFENDKTLTCNPKTEIAKTDNGIDAMVYKLYGLSDDEIKIVEDIK